MSNNLPPERYRYTWCLECGRRMMYQGICLNCGEPDIPDSLVQSILGGSQGKVTQTPPASEVFTGTEWKAMEHQESLTMYLEFKVGDRYEAFSAPDLTKAEAEHLAHALNEFNRSVYKKGI